MVADIDRDAGVSLFLSELKTLKRTSISILFGYTDRKLMYFQQFMSRQHKHCIDKFPHIPLSPWTGLDMQHAGLAVQRIVVWLRLVQRSRLPPPVMTMLMIIASGDRCPPVLIPGLLVEIEPGPDEPHDLLHDPLGATHIPNHGTDGRPSVDRASLTILLVYLHLSYLLLEVIPHLDNKSFPY